MHLVADKDSQKISYWAILYKFKRDRKPADVYFQLCDINPKTNTDETDFEKAHERLGHTTRRMSEHYIKIKDQQGVIAMSS
jgi:hypothetical protein